ncbi:MAG: hypothetical protein H0T75_22135 [Rhizobiales bacterium]|nr:hypothetical protein [Hyphomicrobiales bacterium]
MPLTFRKQGGRKRVVAPDGSEGWTAPRQHVDTTVLKALARAHRWQRMLQSGAFANVSELATAERINASYLSRVLRLTLLAPEVVEAILDGTQRAEITLALLMKPFPVEWERQHGAFRLIT